MMKTRVCEKRLPLGMIILLLHFVSPIFTLAQDTLPVVLKIDLLRLEETYNLLDHFGGRIWPGWTNYREIPFLIEYPNGVEMLIGHPNPPEGFIKIQRITLGGKAVYLNSRNEIRLPLRPPLQGGGGPIPFGMNDGKSVRTVRITMQSIPADSLTSDSADRRRFRFAMPSEKQILLFAHELFHCYQYIVHESKYGNLQYNTDENYAAYGEVEGIALENSYLEKDQSRALEFLRDFSVARELKHQSMDSTERLQESEEEINEGTATYVELRLAELVKTGYKPKMTAENDPFYYGFTDADSLIASNLGRLQNSRRSTMESRSRSYSYGAFQAVMLDRFMPDWKKDFFQRGEMLDRLIASLFDLSEEQRRLLAERFDSTYDFKHIFQKHQTLIRARNDALKQVQGRKGVAYVVNFKKTNEYLSPNPRGKEYRLGLMRLFPDGIEKMQIRDVTFTGKTTPMLIDQLYYIRWIDTATSTVGKPFELTWSRKEGEGTYVDAVLTTSGFELRAPKLQVSQQPNRVKLTVLSKVKE